MDDDDDDRPVRGAWAVWVLVYLTAAAGAVAGSFLVQGAWPVGIGVGLFALCVTITLGAITAVVWAATKRP